LTGDMEEEEEEEVEEEEVEEAESEEAEPEEEKHEEWKKDVHIAHFTCDSGDNRKGQQLKLCFFRIQSFMYMLMVKGISSASKAEQCSQIFAGLTKRKLNDMRY